jgi:hypothetical protein
MPTKRPGSTECQSVRSRVHTLIRPTIPTWVPCDHDATSIDRPRPLRHATSARRPHRPSVSLSEKVELNGQLKALSHIAYVSQHRPYMFCLFVPIPQSFHSYAVRLRYVCLLYLHTHSVLTICRRNSALFLGTIVPLIGYRPLHSALYTTEDRHDSRAYAHLSLSYVQPYGSGEVRGGFPSAASASIHLFTLLLGYILTGIR